MGIKRDRLRRRTGMVAVLVVMAVAVAPGLAAQTRDKPTDEKLYRLSEILGAVHYLRELCGANDGQQWREGMRQIIESEGSTAVRRATLSRRFNRGYRGYSRTDRSCTSSAQATIERFLKEAIQISDELIKLAR